MENKTLFFGLLFIGLFAYAHCEAKPDDKTIEAAIKKFVEAMNKISSFSCKRFMAAIPADFQWDQKCFECTKDTDKLKFKGMDCINGVESTHFNFVLLLATAAISLFFGGRF